MIKKALEKYSDQPSFRAAIQGLLLLVDPAGASSVGENWLAGYGTRLQNQRLTKLIEVIELRLKDVEELTVLLTDELYDLFRAASEGSVKTGSEEKIERFANILANKVLDQGTDWDEAQMAVSILSSLEDVHFEVLLYSKDNPNFLINDRSPIYSSLSRYKEEIVRAACFQLIANGLLQEEQLSGRYIGQQPECYKLSSTGMWFLGWISEQVD